MKRNSPERWHRFLAAGTLAAAVAIGAGLAWSQVVAPEPAAPAVTAANKAAAVEAFRNARELYKQDKYAEAAVENDRALKLDPTNEDAKTLRTILEFKKTEATETATTGKAPVAEKVKLLKPSDVSLIRIRELNPEDLTGPKKITGRIDRKVLNEFWDEVVRKGGANITKDAQNAFVNPENFIQQVESIAKEGNTTFMEKVQFNSDPMVMQTYRTAIQPAILQNCATAQCHASEKGGTFRLLQATGGNNELVAYTNFYILSNYVAASGGKLIDRENPDKSLIVQYGLPKTVATYAHPKVDLAVKYSDVTAPGFQAVVTWIKGDPTKKIPGLSFPKPNYGIIYELPATAAVAPPATQPATRPAATRPAPKNGK